MCNRHPSIASLAYLLLIKYVDVRPQEIILPYCQHPVLMLEYR